MAVVYGRYLRVENRLVVVMVRCSHIAITISGVFEARSANDVGVLCLASQLVVVFHHVIGTDAIRLSRLTTVSHTLITISIIR